MPKINEITKADYKLFLKHTKDPIDLCYKIYHSSVVGERLDSQKFFLYFSNWLKIKHQVSILTGSLILKKHFDKKFG